MVDAGEAKKSSCLNSEENIGSIPVLSYEPNKTTAENVHAEAIQTAAMALRFVASLNNYIYKAGEQHRQDQWEATQKAYYDGGGLHPCYD